MHIDDPTLPWLRSYPPGIDWHAPHPAEPLWRVLRDSVARFPERLCLDFLGKTWRYREVGALVSRAAKGLAALGVGRGTRVALVLPNTPFYVVTYYAVLEAGGTVVNVNPLYAEPEIRHLFTDAGVDVAVTLDVKSIYPKVAAQLGRTPLNKIVVCRLADALPLAKGLLLSLFRRGERVDPPADDAHVPFATLVDNDGDFTPVAIDPARDVAVLQYTGGTTGTPKGAMLTHANLVANTRQCVEWFPDLPEGEGRMLAVLPFFHVFAMTAALNVPIARGVGVVMLPRFDIKDLLATIRRTRPTGLPGVPTLYTAIYSHPAAARVDLTCIDFCISGGAPLPAEVKSRFEAVARCTLVEGYGLSECSPVVACNPIHGTGNPGSVGLPLPGTRVRIVSPEDGRLLGPGERGEIEIAGPQVMAGYWRRPEETQAAMHEGWLRTGDLGYLDAEGYLYLVDRIKDLIITGGYNVYPRHVEEAIHRHPRVSECIVIGVPDAYRGQAVKAFVVPLAGASLDEAELRSFLKAELSPMEMPRQIEFRQSLPKTLIGKASKKALQEEEAAAARP
jgi:long-chain acyl-CoA synthetase